MHHWWFTVWKHTQGIGMKVNCHTIETSPALYMACAKMRPVQGVFKNIFIEDRRILNWVAHCSPEIKCYGTWQWIGTLAMLTYALLYFVVGWLLCKSVLSTGVWREPTNHQPINFIVLSSTCFSFSSHWIKIRTRLNMILSNHKWWSTYFANWCMVIDLMWFLKIHRTTRSIHNY